MVGTYFIFVDINNTAMSKLNDSTTLLVPSPRLPGVANIQQKGVTGSRPWGCHILPLSQQLPVVLLARSPDDEVDASYS